MRTFKPLQIALFYLILGFVWILGSDLLLGQFASVFSLSPGTIAFLSVAKGFVYVTITAILLYLLINRRLKYLTQNRDDFKRFFRDNPNPMWIYDLATAKFLLVNKAATKQYGFSEKEFRKMTLYDIRPVQEHERLEENLKRRNPKLSNSGIWMHRNKDGANFFVEIFSGLTKFKGVDCRMVTAINVDQNFVLQRERRHIQEALDNSALVSILDLDGKLIEVNDRFCVTYGYGREELLGKGISMLNSDIHDDSFWKNLWDTVSGGISWRDDICNLTRGGTKVWVDAVITPLLNDQGKPFRFISIQYDITERKRLEETKSRLLEDFAAYSFQTSHQLRGPLSRLLGLVQLYKETEHRDFVLREVSNTAKEIDDVIREMNDSLHRNSQEYVREKYIKS